jgi:hypothetical protein
VFAGRDLAAALEAAGVLAEPCRQEAGIQFIRRRMPEGHCYFLNNQSDARFDGWLALSRRFRAATLMDPLSEGMGSAETKNGEQVRLQIEPGESVFVYTRDADVSGVPWRYQTASSGPVTIEGTWNLEFIAGGPSLPAPSTLRNLVSWTSLQPPQTEAFAGTAAYRIEFDRPEGDADHFLLDLGDVRDSARVIINGEEVAVLFAAPYRTMIGPLRQGKNQLRVEVTNVAANRIRDLDRRGVRWRIFHDINVVNIDYRPFDASDWPVRDAGLLGPVTLRPLR